MFKKLLGILLIIFSVGLLGRLIFTLPVIVTEFSEALSSGQAHSWGMFTGTLVFNIIFWVLIYYLFKFGRNLYRVN
jgi:membrane-anchored glycerophosphoryl diester phosphodiesterase (GDPDase)